jgi:hypothetical protein
MDDFRPTSATAQHPHPEELLSPLEQEVLDEYAKLVGNLDDVRSLAALPYCLHVHTYIALLPTYLLLLLLLLLPPLLPLLLLLLLEN